MNTKLSIFALALLLSISQTANSENIVQYGEFVTSAWGAQKLTVPPQILQCANTTSEMPHFFFFWLGLVSNSTRAINQGRYHDFVYYSDDLFYLHLTIEGTFKCIYENFNSMFQKAGRTDLEGNFTQIYDMASLYFQAFGPEWYASTENGFNAYWVSQNYLLSGYDYGLQIPGAIANFTFNSTILMKAMMNGVFMSPAVNQSYPDSIYSCFIDRENDTALFYEFLGNWARKIQGLDESSDILQETFNYLNHEGVRLYDAINVSMWACLKANPDVKRLEDLFGLNIFDVYGQKYLAALDKYIKGAPADYLYVMGNIASLMQDQEVFRRAYLSELYVGVQWGFYNQNLSTFYQQAENDIIREGFLIE